jgi:hypothetical protein
VHARLIMAYSMLQRQEPYREAVGDFFDQLQPKTRLGGSSNAWNIWATA